MLITTHLLRLPKNPWLQLWPSGLLNFWRVTLPISPLDPQGRYHRSQSISRLILTLSPRLLWRIWIHPIARSSRNRPQFMPRIPRPPLPILLPSLSSSLILLVRTCPSKFWFYSSLFVQLCSPYSRFLLYANLLVFALIPDLSRRMSQPRNLRSSPPPQKSSPPILPPPVPLIQRLIGPVQVSPPLLPRHRGPHSVKKHCGDHWRLLCCYY